MKTETATTEIYTCGLCQQPIDAPLPAGLTGDFCHASCWRDDDYKVLDAQTIE